MVLVLKYIRNCVLICLCIICLNIASTVAKEPRASSHPKYTVFEGQAYRWNNQMKKYIPFETPYQRLQRSHLQKQLGSMGSSRATMSQPTRIKWWEL